MMRDPTPYDTFQLALDRFRNCEAISMANLDFYDDIFEDIGMVIGEMKLQHFFDVLDDGDLQSRSRQKTPTRHIAA